MLARPEIAIVDPEGTAWSGTRFEFSRSTRVHWSSILGSHRQPPRPAPSAPSSPSTASAPAVRRSVGGRWARRTRSADKSDPPVLARVAQIEMVEVDAGAERPAAIVAAVPDDLVQARREPAGPGPEPPPRGVIDAERHPLRAEIRQNHR